MDRCSVSMVFFFMVGVAMSMSVMVDAQPALPSCANQLLPCMEYLNSTTKPPDICCNPLKDLNAVQRTCLCKLALSPDILEGFGINMSHAFVLLDSCGVNLDLNLCKASSSALPPSSVQPPATRGGDVEGGAARITFTGLGFVLVVWASLFLH